MIHNRLNSVILQNLVNFWANPTGRFRNSDTKGSSASCLKIGNYVTLCLYGYFEDISCGVDSDFTIPLEYRPKEIIRYEVSHQHSWIIKPNGKTVMSGGNHPPDRFINFTYTYRV